MDQSEESKLSDLNTQAVPQSDHFCPDFLQIESETSVSNNDSPCDSCGNHECSRRLISPQSVEAAEELGGIQMVFWSFFVFVFPLLTGIMASSFATSSCFGTPETWKSATGFIIGTLLGILIARLAILYFKKN